MSFKLDLNNETHRALLDTVRILSEQSLFDGLYTFLGIKDTIKYPNLNNGSTYSEIADNHKRHESNIKWIKEVRFTNNYGSGFTVYNEWPYRKGLNCPVEWVQYVLGLYSLYKENIIKPDDVKWKVETVFRDGLTVTNFFRNDYNNVIRHLYTKIIGKELIDLYLITVYLSDLGDKHQELTVSECVTGRMNYKYEDEVHNLLARYGDSAFVYILTPSELCKAFTAKEVLVSGRFGSRLLDLTAIASWCPSGHFLIDVKNTTKLRLDRSVEPYINLVSGTLREIKPEDFPNQ